MSQERVVCDGKTKRGFGFLYHDLKVSLRGGEESGVPFAKRRKPGLDFVESRRPASLLAQQVREDLGRIPFPLRNRDGREATLREVLLHRRSLVLDDEDRKVPRSRERLVLQSDGLEPFDVVRNAANKDFQGLVSAVVLEGEGQLREGCNRVDLLLQLPDQSLRLLLGGVFFRNVEFKRKDLLADVADDRFHALRLALLDLEHRSDRTEFHEDLRRLRRSLERLADCEVLFSLLVVDDVQDLERVQLFHDGLEVVSRPND